MKSGNQLNDSEGDAHLPRDPFAVDFFGGSISPADEADEDFIEIEPLTKRRVKLQKKSDWHKVLPKISNREAEFSNLIVNLPGNLMKNIAKFLGESIARYTFRQEKSVECEILLISEVNLNESLKRLSETAQIFLTVNCQPENLTAIAALNNDFARSMIDIILGGKGAENTNLRGLSPVETTIVEFLALNILKDLNEYLGETILTLQELKNSTDEIFQSFQRGAEIVLSLDLGDLKGIVTIYAPQNFLRNLETPQNALLSKNNARKYLSVVEKTVRALDLRLQIGTTFLDADSLLFLETDDIVLIEQPLFARGNFAENSQVFAGRGKNVRLRGAIENTEGELKFKIGEITSEESRRKFMPAKFKMDELENEPAENEPPENDLPQEEFGDEQLSPSMENVQVALRVEIAGSKISLRELQNLRSGQIIALGCRPNDPVRLVTDQSEEPVATGELVDIEGQLGVRLTKVFI